jgi:polysaccharide export outer membrane protein
MYINFILLLGLAVMTGCTGMKMDVGGGWQRPGGTENASIEASYRSRISLVPINATVIVNQIRQRKLRSPSQDPLPPQSGQPFVYRVGAQDVLQVTVWDHPELTMPAGQYRTAADTGNLVRQDGTIFYPYIGVVSVAGKSLEEIRRLLAEKLARYIEKPQVDVRVAAFRSKRVYVTGEVVKPGMQPITDVVLHVLEAIQAAGGVRSADSAASSAGQLAAVADLEHVKLTRDGTVYNINMLAMLFGGDLSSNILLRDGDVLYVPDNFSNKVFVLGEVKNPSALLIHNGHMTLAEALGDVGGVDMSTSNPGQIYVIRSGDLVAAADQNGAAAEQQMEDFKPTIFHLDASSPDALILADQFDLQSRDVVFVATAEIVRWGRLLNQLQGTIQSIAVIRALTK